MCSNKDSQQMRTWTFTDSFMRHSGLLISLLTYWD